MDHNELYETPHMHKICEMLLDTKVYSKFKANELMSYIPVRNFINNIIIPEVNEAEKSNSTKYKVFMAHQE